VSILFHLETHRGSRSSVKSKTGMNRGELQCARIAHRPLGVLWTPMSGRRLFLFGKLLKIGQNAIRHVCEVWLTK
jgi:hypothetical protein